MKRRMDAYFRIGTLLLGMLGLFTTVHAQSIASVDKPGPDSSVAPWTVVEQMPTLIGGMAAITEKIRYPERAKDAEVEGTVYVKFVVDTDGTVNRPEVVRGRGFGLDAEVLRVLSEVKFRPGWQGSKRVPVVMYLPVRFELP